MEALFAFVFYGALLTASTLCLRSKSRRYQNVVVACVHDAVCIVSPNLMHSAGYFVADMLWFLIFKRHDVNQLVHHTTCLVATLMTPDSSDLRTGLFLTHIPSPLAYSIFFLRQHAITPPSWLNHTYTIVKVLSIGVGGLGIVGTRMILSTTTAITSKVGVVMIGIVNLVWLKRHLRAAGSNASSARGRASTCRPVD